MSQWRKGNRMPFQPEVNQELVIDGVSYCIAEHPAAPGMPYGQEDRQAIVYQVVAGKDRRALQLRHSLAQRTASASSDPMCRSLFPGSQWGTEIERVLCGLQRMCYAETQSKKRKARFPRFSPPTNGEVTNHAAA